MRRHASPIRNVSLAVLIITSAGCATNGYIPPASVARTAMCPERTVYVCHEQTSLHSRCTCASRQDYYAMFGRNNY